MSDLQEAMAEARAQNIVTDEQARKLAALFAARGLIDTGFMAGLAPTAEDGAVAEASESPRFVRGFHDILITIGVVAALIGLWTLAPLLTGLREPLPSGALAALPVIVALSELLVRRQRLALPAFVLTGFYAVAVVALAAALVGPPQTGDKGLAGSLIFFLSPLLLLPYYWRYRVPVALAAMIAMACLFVFLLTLALLQLDLEAPGGAAATVAFSVGLAAALALFGCAMAFDMSDPGRITRRSDVAFWLHLAAAPALLFTTFGLVMGADKAFWWASNPGPNEAALAIVLVSIMMIVGIVIDRRAFVTAGLLSLGAAVAALVTQSGLAIPAVSAFALLCVGVIVLALGVGWQSLRRVIVAPLPAGLKKRLRPA